MDQLTYYSFSSIIILIITAAAFKYIEPSNNKTVFRFPVIIILWQAIVYLLSINGIYESFELPPNLVLFGILPIFIILAIVSYSKSVKKLINTVPIHIPILFQSFRIFVELLILKGFIDGFAPIAVTFKGYNYEFYFGISAILIGVLYLKYKFNPSILLLWNLIGLIMLGIIVFLFFSCGFAHQSIWNSPTPTIGTELMHMPYLSIATLYMPLAVWMHIFSIRQIRAKKKR